MQPRPAVSESSWRLLLATMIVITVLLLAAGPPAMAQCTDNDGDGYGRPGDPSCPAGEAEDCNDADPDIHPGAPEAWDSFDDDCDGTFDESFDRSCDGVSAPDSAKDVSDTPGSSSADPAIAWTGSQFGVAWYDDTDGGWEVYFALLDRYGMKVAPAEQVSPGTGAARLPAVTWTGREFGVAWQDNSSGAYEIYFARLDEHGKRIGDVLQVTSNGRKSSSVDVTWTGVEYGLIWTEDSNELVFARVGANGNLMGEPVSVTGGEYPTVKGGDIAWGRESYGVVWRGERDGVTGIYCAHRFNLNADSG